MRLWHGRHRLKTLAIGAYLYRVAHNVALDELRKQRVRSRWLASARYSLDAEIAFGPVEEYEQVELKIALDRALQALPIRRREVFVLAYLHNRSYREIAETLGISVATVKNHIAAALADLRNELRSSLTSRVPD